MRSICKGTCVALGRKTAITAKSLLLLTRQIADFQRVYDIGGDSGHKALAIIGHLDDHDYVQSVSANFTIRDEAMAEIKE